MGKMSCDTAKRFIILLAMTVFLACGCGGSDGSSDTAPVAAEVKTGIFLDSAVRGLTYKTLTQQGKTDPSGAFLYKDGETVAFYIGNVLLGQAQAKPVMTPLDLAGNSADVTHPKVEKICRLLQSLDIDNDPENGIELSEPVSELVSTFLRDLDTIADLENNTDIQNLFAALKTSGIFPQVRPLRSAEQAIHHMKQTLAYSVHGISVAGKAHDFNSANVFGRYGGQTATDGVFAPAPEKSNEDVVREIEEADIIKAEGTYLYILNRYRGLAICDISHPDAPTITGRTAVKGEPKEMYIRGQRAYIITSFYSSAFTDLADSSGSIRNQGTQLYVVNIADKTRPEISGELNLNGYINESRIVGDILYAVCTDTPAYAYPVDLKDAAAVQGPETWVASFDLSNPVAIRKVGEIHFGGAVSQIHVTESAVFIASSPFYNETSVISYTDISDPGGSIIRRGSVKVAGSIQDKFKISYDSGYLRVCTYEWKNSGVSRLFVIDVKQPDSLTVAASLELGKGEQLFATRFDSDKAYIVTYERKDPLWIIDLKNPEKPEIRSELIVPGWSTYIEPLGDRLITLGVDDTDGQKVSVSLFDVSDPSAPALMKRISFGDENGWSSSSAYSDVKAFTVLKDMGLILLPYTVSGGNISGTENRLQLIDFSTSTVEARGWIAQKGEVLRSRSIADRLFSVSADELKVIDATDRDHPKITATRTLAENIMDFIPLENQHGVRVISNPNGGFSLQAVPLSDPESGNPVGEIAMESGNYSGIFSNGNLTYVVFSKYGNDALLKTDLIMPPYNAGTVKIQIVDFSMPSNPILRGNLEMEGNYNTPAPMISGMAMRPFYNPQKMILLNKDVLLFIRTSYSYLYMYAEDEQKDAGESETLLMAVDLKDPDAPQLAAKLPITADYASSFLVKNNHLYFSYTDHAAKDDNGRDTLKFYLGRIDLTDYQNPVQLKGINIPGICVGFDSAGHIAFTMNSQWEKDKVVNTFNAVKIENDQAFLLSGVEIENSASDVVIADGYAYLSGYSYLGGISSGYLNIIDLADPQKPVLYKNDLAMQWSQIIGAGRLKVFINTGGGTACIDAANPGKIRLDEFKSHQWWPDRIFFTDHTAYLPLGYYGLWVKQL